MKSSVSFNSELSKFGIGIFDTIKVENSNPICIDMHLDRMYKSSSELNILIKYNKKEFKDLIYNYILDNKITNKAIRVSVFDEGYNITHRDLIYTKEMYEKGFTLITSPIKRGDSIIYKHKTSNYFENIYTRKYANKNGFDEGLFIDLNGVVLECAMSNIFFIKNRVIYTPSEKLPIINGIMKKRIVALCGELNIKVVESDIKITEIDKFEYCFISNSLMGIMKVIKLNDISFNEKNEVFDYIWRKLMI